jgi:hypothetical protein
VLGYRVYIPDNSVLTWGIALNPRVWSPDKGDGVVFGVAVKDADQSVDMYAMYLDPKNVAADRHLLRFALPLFGYAGETVVIELTTQSGPRGDANFDSAGWLNPRLTRVPVNTNFERYPYERLPFAMMANPLVTSQNYMASIANWQTDKSNTDRVSSWQRSIRAWSASPLSGLGPGSVDEAAVRSAGPRAVVTESQIMKVLVETGIAGVALWLALCIRGLCVAWTACRRQPELLWILSGLVCICVSSLAFQVLEVKQIGALFWLLMGCVIALELQTGRGRTLALESYPPVVSTSGHWWRTFAIKGPDSPGCSEDSAAEPPPTSAKSTKPGEAKRMETQSLASRDLSPADGIRERVAAYGKPSDVSPVAAIDVAHRSVPPESASHPTATLPHLSTVRRVRLAATEAEANDCLGQGWELLSIKDTGRGAKFVLGWRAALPESQADDERGKSHSRSNI